MRAGYFVSPSLLEQVLDLARADLEVGRRPQITGLIDLDVVHPGYNEVYMFMEVSGPMPTQC